MAVIEVPGLYAGNTTVLRPRMTVAYEPMVVMEGLGTGVVEDTLRRHRDRVRAADEPPIVTWTVVASARAGGTWRPTHQVVPRSGASRAGTGALRFEPTQDM